MLSLLVHHRQASLLLRHNVLCHLALIDLVVENVLVRILHFSFVHALLFQLLGCSHPLLLLPISVGHLQFLLSFLALQSEVSHVLLVDVCLLIESCALVGQVTLLVRVPGVVLELWLSTLQRATRLARLKPSRAILRYPTKWARCALHINSLKILHEERLWLTAMMVIASTTHLSHDLRTGVYTNGSSIDTVA